MKKSFICLALVESTLEKNLNKIREYHNDIDIIELRADFLDQEEYTHLDTFPSLVDLPVILTIRKDEDGGKFCAHENDRLKLLEKGINGKYAYIDLEENFTGKDFCARVRERGIRIIRSFHDFNGVPDNLTARIKNLPHSPEELPKAAVMPKNSGDLNCLLKSFSECEGMEKILLGMGTFGFSTRILASLLGSYLTYCSVPDKLAAPGHIDPATLNNLYRFRNLSSKTSIYGIIGNPVMHTFSPKIHNRGFALLGLDAVYLPFHVDSVKDFLQTANLLNIRGFSVTIPHKEEIIQYLAQKDKSVRQIDACNTVARLESLDPGIIRPEIIKKKPGWFGLNSDGIGFVETLKERIYPGTLRNLRATVIGAGGAAKAIVFALVSEGTRVLIINRTIERAKTLGLAFHAAWAGLDAGGLEQMENYSDIIVQTTSVGMEPNSNMDPVPDYRFKGHEIVYDIVYKPEMTLLLQRAQMAGCRIIPGKEMLLGQAFVQFKLFTGKEFPDKKGIREIL